VFAATRESEIIRRDNGIDVRLPNDLRGLHFTYTILTSFPRPISGYNPPHQQPTTNIIHVRGEYAVCM